MEKVSGALWIRSDTLVTQRVEVNFGQHLDPHLVGGLSGYEGGEGMCFLEGGDGHCVRDDLCCFLLRERRD